MDNGPTSSLKTSEKFPHEISSIYYDSNWLGSSGPSFFVKYKKYQFQIKRQLFRIGACLIDLDLHFWRYLV